MTLNWLTRNCLAVVEFDWVVTNAETCEAASPSKSTKEGGYMFNLLDFRISQYVMLRLLLRYLCLTHSDGSYCAAKSLYALEKYLL